MEVLRKMQGRICSIVVVWSDTYLQWRVLAGVLLFLSHGIYLDCLGRDLGFLVIIAAAASFSWLKPVISDVKYQ